MKMNLQYKKLFCNHKIEKKPSGLTHLFSYNNKGVLQISEKHN